MKKKEFITEAKRKKIMADKEKAIVESFAKTFNKIKRIDEDDVSSLNQPNTKFIPNEIFALEKFEVKDYEIIYESITIEFADIKTETNCFNLIATVDYNSRVEGSYSPATWGASGGSDEEYPELIISDEEVVDIKYVDCNSREEYQLTDEMKKIAIPYVIHKFNNDLYLSISEEQWELRYYDYDPPSPDFD